MVNPIGIGVLGLGKHGERYVGHLERDLPGLRVVAVSRRDDRQGRSRAASLDAHYHADVWGLAADRAVDAVVSVVPPALHPEVVRACAAEGKPLLLEKPFAIHAEDAASMAGQIQDAGIPVMVAQTLRFSSAARRARDWLGEVGSLHQIILGQSFEPSRLSWLDDPEISGGGNILHTGIHEFDLARYLTGAEVLEVHCMAGRVATEKTEDSFVASLFMGDASGCRILGSVTASRGTRSRYGEIRLIGSRGQIFCDHALHRAMLLQEGRVVAEEVLPDIPTVREALAAFEKVVRGTEPPPITVEDGLQAVGIADACYQSLRSGRRVTLPQDQENTNAYLRHARPRRP
ncbi:MAG: Gfo/Idh/MocA family oxidoreductase [Candidatus Binatia bacterium]|nr:Gfo/Idh/MocA family oxidoreductase [Candidatus Binatia bacterium]MDG2010243.1 Gfo/Idh/MocA family oxidoreductase [Candidatus Binatia bacterium]HAC79299.1 hypothetical protein [Deltaproteobacteria bacterium]